MTQYPATEAPSAPSGFRQFAHRHPLTTFLAIGIGVTWPAQFVSLANGWELMPALLLELAALLGAATAITAWTAGRAGVRRLFGGVLRWRIGWGRTLVLVTAMPALTLLVAAGTGTLRTPPDGWGSLVAPYLLQTLIFGLLLGNVWEETAWGGFLQNRLMARHGLLVGSLLTALPFFIMHVPLAFEEHGWVGTTWGQAAFNWSMVALVAPFFRYLLGTLLVDTGGSVLAIGLLHASFNGAGSLAAAPAGWQYIPAVILLTLLVVAYRRWRGRSFTQGHAPALLPAVDSVDPALSPVPRPAHAQPAHS